MSNKLNETESFHGICLPLSALRTEKSSGIGEFLDLLPVIDWMKKTNFNVIQLLPLNDTGHDPSPYNPLSSCALHPIYLSLQALPCIEKYPDLQNALSLFGTLNSTRRISYQEVLNQKLTILRKYCSYEGVRICQDQYHRFISEHAWVEMYAIFKTMKAHFQEKAWWDWPEEMNTQSSLQYKDELCLLAH